MTLRDNNKLLNTILNSCSKLLWVSEIDCDNNTDKLTAVEIEKLPFRTKNILENRTLRIVASRTVT